MTNYLLQKRLNNTAYIVSFSVLVLVGVMRRYKIDLGVDFSFLPPVHATLNTLVAIFLLLALYFIKQKKIGYHRFSINLAMVFSALFLVCYVLYHFTTPETKYCGTGSMRVFYLILLFSHIVLAAVSLPFILLTYIKAYTQDFERHKAMARYVYPVWLYVAITGPICYLLLRPCF